tara:strand:+ start:333 stop:1208 length:876 start_codon:yes stop_codon:yes gene_type:complete
MEKFLLFTTGSGSADPLNWSSDEASLYSTSELKGMKPSSSRSIDLFFETTYGKEVVTLGIKNSTHTSCMRSIVTALNSNQVVVAIADVDNHVFCSPYINSVTITSQETYCQKITGNTKTKINAPRSNYSSCLITNTDGSDAVRLGLYLASQVGTDITSTTVLAAETEAASTSSVDLTVDTVSATDDLFLNERVYVVKNDSSTTPGRVEFVGTCTSVVSSTVLRFSGGLEHVITDNDALYTGTRYDILKNLSIPLASTLKLESNEISFDNSIFDLYALSGDSDGQLTFAFNY